MTVDPSAETDAIFAPAGDLGEYLFVALGDPAELTGRLCAVESVSGNETVLADAVVDVLERISAGPGPDLEILRDGDTIVARTNLGLAERIVVAGHLDTVPVEDNLPPVRTHMTGENYPADEVVWGRGACDMKAGVAMQLATAAALTAPNRDVSWVFYDHEEVDASLNGLGRVSRNHPDWLTGDFAILGEPSNASVEGGCNGTIRVDVTTTGVRAHSARAFMGVNAIHSAAEVLTRLAEFETDTVTVDGLDYRESLSAVNIRGGVAGNVVPDECVVSVNYRFAPSKSAAEAESFLREFFTGFDVVVTDAAEGARPGLDRDIAQDFIDTLGLSPAPKLGWTDVSRFSALGVPAVNFGPGNPLYAHKSDEHVRVAEVEQATATLRRYLQGR
ncbi:succinyl-diaminopimelate desuccinylase [Brevibacterium linens]|uniref:Succinyl-diaminopimelate desuccinylase n=2 Tax=Brevibacterium linens TaxID=1703 RepID=A0A2H1HVW9_BRELN|nr:succinyl-diaminopimelate desuccinylase [Brevibacterium linens]AZU00530.1 succinyl-diaminopimelate desuccinylase [Brevibacterium linens]KAB1949116.1 succinyl-diaminopimelate desuccinylase [Brevibacterium linens ATCC 9172]SMX67083.1 succinyldiaminopimelate desuccinylase [Brevibacterium linens]SMX70231.1 succinyldiaminopimelate desuccinylase [Brevibacterium linens ATCC 9172]